MAATEIEIPKGLIYQSDYLNDTEIESLKDFLSELDLIGVSENPNSRKVKHYGFKYSYRSRTVDEETEEMPELISNLADRLSEEFDRKFNQCIINRYLPGQGISPHTDNFLYGDTIACITIGVRELEFNWVPTVYKLITESGSLYVMTGESRDRWKHGMIPRKSDIIDGKRVKRDVVYSITFRIVE